MIRTDGIQYIKNFCIIFDDNDDAATEYMYVCVCVQIELDICMVKLSSCTKTHKSISKTKMNTRDELYFIGLSL